METRRRKDGHGKRRKVVRSFLGVDVEGGGGAQGKRKGASVRLAGSWDKFLCGMDASQNQQQPEVCVYFTCKHCDVNDAETSAYFHDLNIAIQHSRKFSEPWKRRAADGEDGVRTATMLFFMSMDGKDKMLTTDGDLHTRHRPRSVVYRRETAEHKVQSHNNHEEQSKGKHGRTPTTAVCP